MLKNKPSSALNEITIGNRGVFILLTLLQVYLYSHNMIKFRKGNVVKNLYFCTFLPLNINFALIFFFMSPTLLMILRATILDPICRLLKIMKASKSYWWWRSIRFENTVGLHIFTALWLLFWAYIHGMLALVYFYLNVFTGEPRGKKQKRFSIYNDHSPQVLDLIPSNKGKKNVIFLLSKANLYMFITGFVLLGLFTIISVLALPKIRKRFFELFYYTHHLFIPAIFLYYLHAGKIDIYWGITIGIYIADRVYRTIMKRRLNNPTLIVKRWAPNTLEIRIPARMGFYKLISYPRLSIAQYLYLNCPSLSFLQWHPFDTTFAPGDTHASVFISCRQGWTQKLYKKIFNDDTLSSVGSYAKLEVLRSPSANEFSGASFLNNNNNNDTSVIKKNPENDAYHIQNFEKGTNPSNTEKPSIQDHTERNQRFNNFEVITAKTNNLTLLISTTYKSPLYYVIENQIGAFIVGGTGVAVALSIGKMFIRNLAKRYWDLKLEKVYIFWICSNQQMFNIIEEMCEEVVQKNMQDKVEIVLYKTAEPIGAEGIEWVNKLQTLAPQGVTWISIRNGRPDISEVYQYLVESNISKTVGVAAVGPKKLIRTARRASVYYNRSKSAKGKINFYQEFY